MKLHQLGPLLQTNDLGATIRFYEEVLGFKASGSFPNFVTLCRDEVQIMFIRSVDEAGNTRQVETRLTGNLYIFMEEVDRLWLAVKDKVTITSSLADREYQMRDFSILDNNGYELVFGEDISRRNPA